jgi:ribonuclease HI/ADP-ribose pyrophosphatase YjhB (NUDIX family)
MNSQSFIVHTDGGARGNPGPAGIGYTIFSPNNTLVAEHGETIGKATNNEAEYKALIEALKACTAFPEIKEVSVHSDSELMVSQLKGIYKVSVPTLKELYGIVKQLESKFHKVTYTHVRRGFNKRADELVNAALDGKQISTLVKEVHSHKIETEVPERVPQHAKIMFHGKNVDVYQWQQELYNGDIATFEKSIRKDCVGVLAVTSDKKILLTTEEQPTYSEYLTIPGGRCELNESPIDAAKRELQEETGYTTANISPVHTFAPIGDIEWNFSLYIARDCKKTMEVKLDPGEKISVQEVTFDQFIESLYSPDFRNFPVQLFFFEWLSRKNGQKKLEAFLFEGK